MITPCSLQVMPTEQESKEDQLLNSTRTRYIKQNEEMEEPDTKDRGKQNPKDKGAGVVAQ